MVKGHILVKSTITYVAILVMFPSIATWHDLWQRTRVGQVFLSSQTLYPGKLSGRTEYPRKMCNIILWADFHTTLVTVLTQHMLSDEIKDFPHGIHFGKKWDSKNLYYYNTASVYVNR